MIGITGQIGAGKSFVGHRLRERKIRVIDADLAVHQLYRDNLELRTAISREFGAESLTETGVNRKFFADLIFKDAGARVRLENLVYPVLTAYILRESPAFVEAALFENVPALVEHLSEIWVVTAPAATRLQRLTSNRKMNEDDARRRMELQQAKDSEECWRRLYPGKVLRFIDNDGDETALDEILQRMLPALQ